MNHHIGSALRRLRETPGFTAIALASLALGIGLNILIFSFTSPVLVKALPYPAADRLLEVTMAPPDRPEAAVSLNPALYFLLRDRTSAAFDAIGVFDAGRTANIAGDSVGLAERVAGHRISASGFAALGASPLLGRLPLAADESADAPPTMVLSYTLWQKRFAGRDDVINQTVNVDGLPTQIIGIMPEGFGLLDNSSDVFFTSGFEPAPGQERQRSLRGVGRLRAGASIADAQAAVNLAMNEYAQMFPGRDEGWTVQLAPWREAKLGGLRQPLLMTQLAVGAMLLLLCVSLAVLLRTRASAGETSANRVGHQIRRGVVLTEGLLLAFGGGILAIVLVALGLPALLEITPSALPRLDDVALDGTVLAFSLALCVVTGIVIGIVPAWQASRSADTKASGNVWLEQISAGLLVVLLALQVALAFVLLAGAGLAIRAYGDLRGRDVGVDPSGLLSVDVHLPRDPYVTPNVARAGSIDLSEYNPAGAALYDRVRAALQTMPGVVQAAGVGSQPFGNAPFVQFWVDDQELSPDNQVSAQFLTVTENYFNTMGIRLVGGRDFSATDQPDSTWVVLVNETLARRQWPDGNAIGHTVTLTFHPDDYEPAREIIGVVADTLPFRGASEVPPLMYVLHRQQATQQRASLEGRRTVMSLITRTAGDPLALGDEVRALVGTVDMTAPVTSIRSVESYLNGGQVLLFQFAAALLGAFALVALVISTAGVYGLNSYGVARRRPTLTLVLRTAAAVVVGVVVGREAWLRLGSVIEGFLTNLTVTPSDSTTLSVAGGLLIVTAIIAVLVPAMTRSNSPR
jgi:putative ABC transport system permease protein